MEKTSKKTVEAKIKKGTKSPGATRGRKRKLNHETNPTSGNINEVSSPSQTKQDGTPTSTKTTSKEVLCFKNPKHRDEGFVIQTRIWKNLKQIMNTQKSQALPGEITYASIDAPATTKPKKKYSDLSGLPALYTDPHTKLRYANSNEYRQIQHLSSDTITGLLALRKASH